MDYISCFSVSLLSIDSEMAVSIGLKLSGMVEGKCENNLAKRFFGVGIQNARQMDYIVKKESFVFFGLSVFSIFSN